MGTVYYSRRLHFPIPFFTGGEKYREAWYIELHQGGKCEITPRGTAIQVFDTAIELHVATAKLLQKARNTMEVVEYVSNTSSIPDTGGLPFPTFVSTISRLLHTCQPSHIPRDCPAFLYTVRLSPNKNACAFLIGVIVPGLWTSNMSRKIL